MRRRGIFLAAAAVAVSTLAAPSPALAAETATAVARAQRTADLPTAPILVADRVAAEHDFVRWLSVHDPRATVRSVARSALLSSGGATAITEFLNSGYAAALDRAAQTRVRQLDYANRMAGTHPAQFYPWVNAAARRAANGTDAELTEFSSTGYAAALAKDNAKVPYDDGVAQVTEDDRGVLGLLAQIDPAAAVRERAADAVRDDAEVAEFLRYGWLSAAGIDADTFRAQYVAEEWARWQEARHLTAEAVRADKAAREEGLNPVVAIQAWQNVVTRLAPQPARWDERGRFARDRVEAWTWNVQLAGDAASPLWASLVAKGPAVRTQWISEVTGAAEQSAWWNDLILYALAARDAWLRPTSMVDR